MYTALFYRKSRHERGNALCHRNDEIVLLEVKCKTLSKRMSHSAYICSKVWFLGLVDENVQI